MASLWELYAGHRARLTATLEALGARAGGRLCILGAGRCNDVDLRRLATTFGEIHLVDSDATAVGAAMAQVGPLGAKIVRHVPVDLSGFSKRLRKWRSSPPTVESVDVTTATAARSLIGSLGGPYDVVVSTCVLTQMAFHLREVLGNDHRALAPLRTALLNLHIGTLVGLTAPEGSCLFVSDLVSSTHYPLGTLDADADLAAVMRDAVASGKFYSAAHPELVAVVLRNHAPGAYIERIEPWLWTAEHERTYLVYAYRVSKSPAA